MDYYFSIMELINEKGFEMYVPFYYQPNMPKEMKEPDTTPLPKANPYYPVPTKRFDPRIFIPDKDPNCLQWARYSIGTMIDMHRKDVQFTLLYEQDVVEILDAIDRYLNVIKVDVESGASSYVDYAKSVISFRAEVYKHYFRYMKTHPEALDKLYPGGKKEGSFFDKMNTIGLNSVGEEFDPLLAKRDPPYDLEKTKPKEQTAVEGSRTFEDTYGVATGNVIKDDGRDFNFEDFLKGS